MMPQSPCEVGVEETEDNLSGRGTKYAISDGR